MAYVFYGQDTLVEHNKRYDEIGIFLPNSHFLKHWRNILKKPRRLSMRKNNTASASAASYVDIMEKNHMEIPWHDYADADSHVIIRSDWID